MASNREALEAKMGAHRILVVAVPGLPPAECSKNARVHWAVAAKAAKQYRRDVGWAAKAVLPPNWKADKVQVSLMINRPYLRESDEDNWWTRFKAGRDGLVDAGVVPNDDSEHMKNGTITFAKGQALTTILVEVLR